MADQPAPLGQSYDEVKSDNLATAPLNNVKKAVEDNVSDPLNSEDRNIVTIGEPRRKSSSVEWPYIAIVGVTENGQETKTMQGDYRLLNGSINIDIETVDESVRAKQTYLNLVDQVKELFRVGEKVNLADSSMHGVELVEENEPAGIFEDDKPVLRRELEFKFDSWVFFGGN